MTLLLVTMIALCTAGVILSLVVAEPQIPTILGWLGTLAAALLLWFSGASLFAGTPFSATLWSIPSVATLTLSLDRLSALFLFVAGLVLLPGSVFAAGNLKKYIGHYSLTAFSVPYFALFATLV